MTLRRPAVRHDGCEANSCAPAPPSVIPDEAKGRRSGTGEPRRRRCRWGACPVGPRLAGPGSQLTLAREDETRGLHSISGAVHPPLSAAPTSPPQGGRRVRGALPARCCCRSGSQWTPAFRLRLAEVTAEGMRGRCRSQRLWGFEDVPLSRRSSRPQAKPESQDPLAPSAGVGREAFSPPSAVTPAQAGVQYPLGADGRARAEPPTSAGVCRSRSLLASSRTRPKADDPGPESHGGGGVVGERAP